MKNYILIGLFIGTAAIITAELIYKHSCNKKNGEFWINNYKEYEMYKNFNKIYDKDES